MSEKQGSWVICIVLAFTASELVGVRSAFAQAYDRPVIAEGEVNSDNVYVRSGDSLNHYTICKLNAGRRVKIVAERGDWYEILPPEDAFSLISGDYVDSADGKHGVVNGNNVRVRTGSSLNDNKYTVQLLLSKGAEVSILGRNPDGFLKIKPPPGATVWVNRSLVERVPDSLVKLEGETKTSGAAPTTTLPTSGAPAATGTGEKTSAAPARGRDTVITKSEALARLDKTPQREELARIDAYHTRPGQIVHVRHGVGPSPQRVHERLVLARQAGDSVGVRQPNRLLPVVREDNHAATRAMCRPLDG